MAEQQLGLKDTPKAETKAVTATTMKQTAATNIRNMLESNKKQIAMALPQYMDADRMLRVAMTTVQKTPSLLECHPITLFGAIIQCAQLGLEPDGITNQAHLVPFYNSKKGRREVQLIVGYKGLGTLAIRSGIVKYIQPRAVYKDDAFDYAYGTDPYIKHKPQGQPTELTHVYAVAKLSNGETVFDVMSKAEVDKIRARAKAGQSGPWVSDYEAMALKTIVRRITKYLPTSTNTELLHKAVALDERADAGLPQDLGTIVDTTETVTENAEAEQPLQPTTKKPEPQKK